MCRRRLFHVSINAPHLKREPFPLAAYQAKADDAGVVIPGQCWCSLLSFRSVNQCPRRSGCCVMITGYNSSSAYSFVNTRTSFQLPSHLKLYAKVNLPANMSLRSSLVVAFTLLAIPLIAQTTTIDASQSTQISSALASYESSLLNGPVATSLAIEVAFDIPTSQLSSLASNIKSLVPFPTTDQYSFATAPPATDLAAPAWATALPTGVQSELISLRSSVVLAEASIVRSVLSITSTPSIASAAMSATMSANMSAASMASTGTSDGTTLGRSRMCLPVAAMVVAVAFVVAL